LALASPQDMIDRYDVRTLGDLVSDSTRTTEINLSSDEKMLTALESATGELIAACFKGKRYSFEDLNGLTESSGAYLRDLICRIAFWKLWQRKPWSDRYEQARAAAEKSSNEALEMLRSGQQVFDVEATKDAGVIEATAVSLVEVQRYNLIVDAARGRFYPPRRVSG